MELTEFTVKSYLDSLSSQAPAPGGGAAAALSGAQGIALTLMVINLTLGKKKYQEWEALCTEVKEAAEPLLQDLMAGMEKDKNAFNQLSAAFKLPKETEEEKKERSRIIGDATLLATEVPLEAMEQGYQGLLLTEKVIGKSNPTAVSDLGVAALNLLACVKSAWLNVLINLPGIKNEELAAEFQKKGKRLYEEAEQLANRIYDLVAEQLKK